MIITRSYYHSIKNILLIERSFKCFQHFGKSLALSLFKEKLTRPCKDLGDRVYPFTWSKDKTSARSFSSFLEYHSLRPCQGLM